jgi:hypothetical protein
LDDEFVGEVHLVIAAIAPQTRVIDLTHRVPAHDVAAAARVLVRAAPWLSDVVLAVVDPGAGTSRRAVVAEAVDHGGGPALRLVGPDNGLLPPVVRAIGAWGRVVAIDRETCPGPGWAGGGPTFDGRDVLAVAAAHLCKGVDPGRLGPEVAPGSLVDLDGGRPPTRPGGGGDDPAGRVQWIDHFGNVELDVAGSVISGWPTEVEVVVAGGREVPAVVVAAYEEIPAGRIGLLVDSEGWVSLAANRASAAALLAVAEGDPVVVRPRP